MRIDVKFDTKELERRAKAAAQGVLPKAVADAMKEAREKSKRAAALKGVQPAKSRKPK